MTKKTSHSEDGAATRYTYFKKDREYNFETLLNLGNQSSFMSFNSKLKVFFVYLNKGSLLHFMKLYVYFIFVVSIL